MKKWLIAGMSALILAFSVHATIEIHEFDSMEQELQFKELSNTLRCPKCQNNTIGDSNAELAQDLRQKVYEMTKEGKSKSEIVDYMIARYGNFVTYNPPFTLGTAILWAGPLSVVLIGFGMIFLRSRKTKAKVEQPEVEWSEEKEAELNALLDEKKTEDKQ
ncbi:cytochrome c-type biogenesis protein [Vibrio cionasavignyae]|uniref:cytochrome c-type biogenesis protein n=1 Tax=Vibrio cionasavignyae TaxID=2910252 RepID=UPI003D13C3BF